MKAVVDRIVQYANRYKLTNVETGEVLGTFDFEEVTGTVQQVGTEIDKELFDSIANDLAARVKLSGGELAGTIVTFSDINGTAANVASGDTSATLWGKVKNWFSRLKALAFKNKVASGDFEAGAIKNADVATDAAIAQSKVSGLMTDYVASIGVSGRTLTFKNKSGATMGTATTQDTTYELASQSGNGLMSANDKTKLDGIESGAQKNTVLGVKGGSESAYRTGNVNITKENIGLGNVDNTSDEDKPVSAATQTALNGKANTSGSYPDITVGNAEKLGNKAASEYASASDIPDVSNFAEKTGTYSEMSVGNATNATNAANATKATQDANGNVIDETYSKLSQVVRVDAAQSLTDAEKTRAKDNVAISTKKAAAVGISTGWYRVAKLDNQTVYSVTIGQGYNYFLPVNVKLALNLGYNGATITQENGIISDNLLIDRVRVCVGTTTGAFFDVHIFNANLNTTKISIDRLYSGDNAVAIETYEDWEYIGTSDTVAGYNVTQLDIVSGTNTSGQVYQQGAPVFATDPTKLEPSTANGWTQISNTGSLPSAGTYYVFPGTTSSVGIIGTAIIVFDGTNNTFGATGGLNVVNVGYVHNNTPKKWYISYAGGEEINSDYILYKRIA